MITLRILNKRIVAGWKFPLFLGILLPLLLWLLARAIYPPLDPRIKAVAQLRGMNPYALNDIMRIMDKAQAAGDLSDRDWAHVLEVFRDPDTRLRSDAISVMMLMRKSPRRGEILALVRPLLKSPNTDLQCAALFTIWKLKDSNWTEEVIKRRNDPDPGVRDAAQIIIKKAGIQ